MVSPPVGPAAAAGGDASAPRSPIGEPVSYQLSRDNRRSVVLAPSVQHKINPWLILSGNGGGFMLAKSTVHHLELRLTQDHALVAAAQALRYRVFYEEMGAVADPGDPASRLDADAFDAIADHLLVLDTQPVRRAIRSSSAATACCAARWRRRMAGSTRPRVRSRRLRRPGDRVVELGRAPASIPTTATAR
jgi:putative hemolysin